MSAMTNSNSEKQISPTTNLSKFYLGSTAFDKLSGLDALQQLF